MKKIMIMMILVAFFIFPNIVDAKVKVANTEYETLDEAIVQAKEGDTITLLDDEDVTDSKYYAYYNFLFPDNSTLDLNGHTIVTGFKNGAPTSVWLGNNITIKNGKFESKNDADYALFLGDIDETSNITLENIEVSTGINIFNTLNVTLKNVTATGQKYYAIWLDEHATATIESGNFNTKGIAVVGITQAKDEEGNIFKSELIIKGGTFKAEKEKLSLSETNEIYLPPIIKGGTYDFDVTEFVVEGYECTKQNDKFVVDIKEYDRDIVFDENIDNLPLKVNMDELNKILLDTINNTTEINIDKKDIKVALEINDTKPTEETTKKMLDKIKKGTIASYFDVSINVIDKNTNKVIGNITELSNKISLIILIPDNLKASEEYFRKYYVLREHNGIIDIIEPTLSEDKTTLMFETDKFSTYALVYEDINNIEIENPNTKDNLKENIILMSISSSIALIGILYLVKKGKMTKSL